eukprot:698073_1
MELCDEDAPFNGAVLEFVIALPIVIVLQLLLLCHTIRNEYRSRGKHHILLKLRFFYILLQLFGLLWSVIDLLRFVVDPFTLMLRDDIMCNVMAYTPKVVPILYYSVYLYQIYIRTESSFQNSAFAFSKRTKCMLLLFLVLIPSIAAPISFFIVNRENTACILSWKPLDFPSLYNDSFSFCALSIVPAGDLVINIITAWVGIANLIFGIIFCCKLNKLLVSDQAVQNTEFHFKSLIIKCCILTVTGSISIIASYALWIWFKSRGYGSGAIFLYVDTWINCLVIGLMFRRNEQYYKTFCCCCGCFVYCLVGKDGEEKVSNVSSNNKDREPKVILSIVKNPEQRTRTQTATSLMAQYGSNAVEVMEIIQDDGEADEDAFDDRVHDI